MTINEKKFNRWFNIFILVGMTVVTCIVTGFKLQGAESGKLLLLLSAFGSLMGVLANVCSANGLIITFLFGLLDVAIYGAVCWINWMKGGPGLGNAILHFAYFVPMQFVGFWQWRQRGAKASSQVKARRLNPGQRWLLTALAIVASVILYFVIGYFDKSAATSFIKVAVILDVIPLVCNIIGQLLMSTAYMEQWIFWLGVNVFSVAMWIHTLRSTPDSSYATVYIVKYSFYFINALNGLRIWIGLSRDKKIS